MRGTGRPSRSCCLPICLILGLGLTLTSCGKKSTTPNQAPTAAFTFSPASGTVDTLFHFDASGSSDPDGTPGSLSARWDWEGDGTFDTAWSTTRTATHVFPAPGTWTVTIQVTDDGDLTDSTTHDVGVQNTSPVAAFSVTPSAGPVSTVFSVDASAVSDLEDAAAVLEVRWDWESDGTYDTAWTTAKTDSRIYPAEGTYTITMEVRDTDGASDSAQQSVTAGMVWTPMDSGTTYEFLGVWGTSATDVFAVGRGGTIRHYDGSTWTAMSNGTSTANYLNGVWGTSSSDVFAVGQNDRILHYDGVSWSTMTSGTSSVALYEVWGSSATDVYVGGNKGTILHYDGSTWSTVTLPASATGAAFQDIWGSSASDIWAAGLKSASHIIFHFNGATWSEVSAAGGPSWIMGLWGTDANNIYAVGYSSGGLRWDGSTWTAFSTGMAYSHYDVWGSAADDVFVSGIGAVARFDGSSWSVTTLSNNVAHNGVWGAPTGEVFLVGNDGVIVRGSR